MKPPKIIAFFLVIILSIQLLPVKQITAWLLSGQLTEEITETKDGGKSSETADLFVKYFLPGNSDFVFHNLMSTTGFVNHAAEALEARHADDIPTPPPNC